VRFNTLGQQIATITRLGDSTAFWNDSLGRVTAILVAPVNGVKRYYFTYSSATAAGRLYQITAPTLNSNGAPLRLITLGTDTLRQVRSIMGADSSIVLLTYTDRRGTVTTFTYDGAAKLASATIGMQGAGPDLTTTIHESESQGIRGSASVDTAVVATRIDGPRTDVGDTTVIRATPYGAPHRITDALGHVTWLDYGNPTFPALVTHEHRQGATASVAVYDARGHLIALTTPPRTPTRPMARAATRPRPTCGMRSGTR
jgi:YD repeat-containing protein